MKTLLVTSEITYVPENYYGLFAELCRRTAPHLAGLLLLEADFFSLIKATAGLCAAGARRTAWTLSRNLVELPLHRREKLFARCGLPVLRAPSVNEREVVDWVRRRAIDLVVNLRTRCIFRRPILRAPRLGCVNVHHGILPWYRGTLCDLHALAAGRPAGFTIHRMNERVDAGRILIRQKVSSGQERDYQAYLKVSARLEVEALTALITQVARTGSLPEGLPNVCSSASYSRVPHRTEIRRLRAMGMVL